MSAPTLLDNSREVDAPVRSGQQTYSLRPAVDWLADNRLFTVALAVAAVLRLVVAIAYAPALEFFGDSQSYLAASAHPLNVDMWHPFGYPLLLWAVSATRSLAVLTTLQHLLGLCSGVLVYRLVRRLGVGPAGATLAAAPVLFDAYQLALEQYVLSETLFTFLLLAAMAVTARLIRRPTLAASAGLGALLGAAAMTRTVGIGVSAAVVVTLLFARVGWERIAAVAVTCAIPVGAYVLAFHSSFGVYAVQGYGGRYLYGIVAPFASCDRARLPADQRQLCPALPAYARPGSNQYVWIEYPTLQLPGTAIQRSQLAGRFAHRVLTHQTGDAARTVAGNLLHYFEPGRSVGPRDWFVGSWQFPAAAVSPAWNIKPATLGYHPNDRVHGHVVVGLAQLLRTYQRVVFVPGPALLAAIVCGALAVARRRRDAARRLVILVLTLTGLVLLAMPAISAGFDWRYLLPAQAVLVPAGVLAARELAGPVRRLLHRFTPLAAAAAAVGLVAPGLASASVYDVTDLTPHAVGAVPATLSVNGHADVHVGKGQLLGVQCFRNTEGQKRLYGLAAFPASVDFVSGRPALAQMQNFGLTNGELAIPGTRPAGDFLRSAVLSPSYPHTSGAVYAYVASSAGVLRYVDPLGGGAAAWSFRLPPPPPPQPHLGTACTGSTPWAGVQLSYLKIRGVPSFTALPQLTFGYGLTAQAWRADSYDVRFRVQSPTGPVGAWQYPRQWQRTALTEQTLLDLTPGATYCVSVRARDSLGVASAWRQPTCTTRPYDDAALPAGPDWSRVSGRPGFYFDSYTATRAQNATIAMSGTFARVQLGLYHCAACGVLDVYLDGKLFKSLDLASTNGDAGLATWTSRPVAERHWTLTLKVRSRDRIVAIDAFGLLR